MNGNLLMLVLYMQSSSRDIIIYARTSIYSPCKHFYRWRMTTPIESEGMTSIYLQFSFNISQDYFSSKLAFSSNMHKSKSMCRSLSLMWTFLFLLALVPCWFSRKTCMGHGGLNYIKVSLECEMSLQIPRLCSFNNLPSTFFPTNSTITCFWWKIFYLESMCS